MKVATFLGKRNPVPDAVGVPTKTRKRIGRKVRATFRCMQAGRVSRLYDLPTFCDHGPDHRTTKLHRYTACYLPELAARLIRRHSRPKAVVLDSFLGGGTTAIQAVANERQALGIDVHPAAVEIAQARLAPVFPNALEHAIDRIKRALKHGRPTKVDLPSDPGGWEWERWFPTPSHPVLSQLRCLITGMQRSDVRRLLLVATAGALKQVSFWYSHATKLQFDGKKKPQDLQEVMIQRLEAAQKINEDLWSHVGGREGTTQRRSSARLMVGDCSALPFDSESADLAVSSPPYFIAYDYAKLLRLTSWWILGRVPDGTGHLEVDGRGTSIVEIAPPELGEVFRRTFGAALRKLEVDDSGYSASHVRTLIRSLPPFFEGLRCALSEFLRVLRPAAKLCLVVGNTRHCGITIPTAEITMELAMLQGFHLVAVHRRRQHSATQPQGRDGSGQFTSDDALSQYSYRDEYVVVMRKP